ncbi:MAG: GGDEF domain-containing protein [Treponema sp.]|jgi:diguanylate cyclase (GGDEF)-like protein|nr:GGDEF domain-containing protein [Treponema sp.]
MSGKITFSPADESALRCSPLFSGFDESEFNTIAAFLRPLRLKEGESIFKEGDAGEEMFVLFSGALSAFCAQSDGTQRRVFEKEPGDFFGEMSIIAHMPRSATITAATDSGLAVLRKIDFFRIIYEQPLIGFRMLRTICGIQNQWLDQNSKSYSDLMRWGETARRRAITDELTGLYNRRFLEESIKNHFDQTSKSSRNTFRKTSRKMSMLMMDLDKVHYVNEHYGFKGGDIVITTAAGIIRSCLRQGDIPARLAGDEFSILLPDTDTENAGQIAEQIRKKIEENQIEVPESPDTGENISISTCTSIGIATTPTHADTAEALILAADSALRRAKDLGRNRVETA